MIEVPMYPLRFEPIYQYRVWGGRHLADLLTVENVCKQTHNLLRQVKEKP
jgi:hypothetical protein